MPSNNFKTTSKSTKQQNQSNAVKAAKSSATAKQYRKNIRTEGKQNRKLVRTSRKGEAGNRAYKLAQGANVADTIKQVSSDRADETKEIARMQTSANNAMLNKYQAIIDGSQTERGDLSDSETAKQAGATSTGSNPTNVGW